jgi:beta-xylosidase
VRSPARRLALVLVAALAGCAEIGGPGEIDPGDDGAPSGGEPLRYANPVIPATQGGVADPGVVLADDGRYYMVSTGGSRGLYPLRVSDDLVAWEHIGYVFPSGSEPAWVESHPWAPELHQVAGRYVVYYSAKPKDGTVMAVGAAVADRPTGPWVDRGPILAGEVGAIDPNYFRDPLDGRHYLLWKHELNGVGPGRGTPIYLQEHAPDGLSLIGERTELVRNDRSWEGDLIEGPWMLFKDGYYYLFYAGNAYYDQRYATGVARSRRADVPLAEQLAAIDAPPRLEKHGPPILASDGQDPWQGPGHGSVVTGPDGLDYFVFHAWQKGLVAGGHPRLGMLEPIRWRDGWPTIGDGKVATSVR